MRKLLLFFAMLCVSIGAWAEVSVSTLGGTCTITNDQAGNLASFAFSADDKAATKVIVSGPVSTADLNHLSELTSAVTLDLDGCEASDDVSGFTVASSVDYVSLPAGLNREQVKAFGEANTGIKSAYSAFPHFNKVERSTSTNVDEFVCYVREGGSLRSCINSTNSDPANFVKKAQYLTIIGNAMPLDYVSGNVWGGKKVLSSDGHVSVSVDVSSTNVVFTGTGTVALSDNTPACTFMDADIVSLDLRDMRLSGPNMEADLTLSVLGYKPDKLKYVVLPIGDTNFKTLPAGCIGMLQSMMSINVPSTVEVMKSGSLFGSAMLCHVWTDGTDADKRYDYGAVLSVAADGTETKVYADDIVDQSPVYGTWTLPASLTYIETIITGAEHVKDLYVMATKAPVCEVDAFGSRMYLANNGYTVPSNQKIIDRDYYYSNTSSAPYAWTTMLHYPTETVAPDLQRYTDPTREYTAATGLKDDKGNTIYLPTQNEWNRAYWQGTTGYVWKAWKTVRDENATIYVPGQVSFGYSNGLQSSANGAYDASWDEDSYLSSFYDVTDGGSLTKPSTLENYYNVYWNESQYKLNNTGAGVQLYPEAETKDATDGEGNVISAERPVYDANGNIIYDLNNTSGTYVKEYGDGYYEDPDNGTLVEETTESYVAQEGGEYVQVITEEYEFVSSASTYVYEEYINQSQYYVLINGEYVQGAGGDTNWWQGDHYKKVSSVSYRPAEDGEAGTHTKVEVGTGNYVTATDEDKAAGKTLYSYGNVWTGNYVAATDAQLADATIDKYSQRMETYTVQTVTNTNDYRGWHQFVLTSYSAFDKVPTIYEKMYTSDTDWWTICLPYDLTYSETMRYFSDGSTVPVVSKLQYVKRDAENKQITLCFTKNLMKNKEDFTNGGSLEGVHGDLDDNGVLKIQVGTAPAADDVVLHAGVAYLIKPTLPASASHTQQIKWTEEITGQALSAEEEADNALYSKITAAQRNESNWGDLVKNAIYTVPAFDIVSDGSLTVDGVKCQKSSEYTYSFVGSLFKSPMPTNCYFLGWDSKKNKAAFWYNKYSDPSDWNWGNMTGIICPNLTEGVSVTPAEGLRVAARWVLDGKMEDDSMGGEAGAKRMPAMLFEVDAPEGSAVTGISEIQKTETEGKTIYNLNGVRVSGSQNSLAKGVYIVNGKKVVVK